MKYLWAYSIPIIGITGIYLQGIWSYLLVVFIFVFIPLLEYVLPLDISNYLEEEKEKRLKDKLYDWLLYINILIVYGCLFFTFQIIEKKTLAPYELVGIVLSLGIILGSNGINVAHELGHRKKLFERILGKILLVPSHYTHFFVEHNHGHHLDVATTEDPSTAKYNQNLYSFWLQSVSGTYVKAWKIQKKLNKINKTHFFSLKNDMLWFTIVQVVYLLSVYFYFNYKVTVLAFIAGIVGFLLLETINYIEHYGLKRKKMPSGRYERVTEKHSWNSNHTLGRILLYELTRHSDHHYKSTKEYQILEFHDESPQLPFGYPTSMVLSFIPPLWYSIMNKRIPEEMK
ncbi:alkane 1-monooxygenase [Flavobacterium sp.]|jgi:alkane 1-monooxygenase|uniref:alkane 1-monooxygenase n=1 Tax=Flavobacterium sp. TaxID=239 RepID=UPI0037C0FC52